MLDVLAERGSTATFFVMAARARRHPGLVRRAVSEGHDVQLHCLRHERHTELTREEVERDTDHSLGVLKDLGVTPSRWRPPWGVLALWTGAVAADRNLRLTGWTVDTHDWDGRPAERMLPSLSCALEPDAVVLMHDGVGPGARRDGCEETVRLLSALVPGGGPLGDLEVRVPWPR